jgi:hypothetical protein
MRLDRIMSREAIVAGAVEHWRAKAKGVPTIVFCAGTGASKKTRDGFRAAEIAAEHVDGSTPAEERDRIMAGLGAGIDVVCSVDRISEGFDCLNVGRVTCRSTRQSFSPSDSFCWSPKELARMLRSIGGKLPRLTRDAVHRADSGTNSRIGIKRG